MAPIVLTSPSTSRLPRHFEAVVSNTPFFPASRYKVQLYFDILAKQSLTSQRYRILQLCQDVQQRPSRPNFFSYRRNMQERERHVCRKWAAAAAPPPPHNGQSLSLTKKESRVYPSVCPPPQWHKSGRATKRRPSYRPLPSLCRSLSLFYSTATSVSERVARNVAKKSSTTRRGTCFVSRRLGLRTIASQRSLQSTRASPSRTTLSLSLSFIVASRRGRRARAGRIGGGGGSSLSSELLSAPSKLSARRVPLFACVT